MKTVLNKFNNILQHPPLCITSNLYSAATHAPWHLLSLLYFQYFWHFYYFCSSNHFGSSPAWHFFSQNYKCIYFSKYWWSSLFCSAVNSQKNTGRWKDSSRTEEQTQAAKLALYRKQKLQSSGYHPLLTCHHKVFSPSLLDIHLVTNL